MASWWTHLYSESASWVLAPLAAKGGESNIKESILRARSLLCQGSQLQSESNLAGEVRDVVQEAEGDDSTKVEVCSKIKVQWEAGYGRYVVAGERIKRGETVLVEPPYAAVSLGCSGGQVCDWCLDVASKHPVACDNGCGMKFCSKDCQRSAWKSFHSRECFARNECPTLMQSLHRDVSIPARVRLVGRILLRRQADAEDASSNTTKDTILWEGAAATAGAAAVDGRFRSGYSLLRSLDAHLEDMSPRMLADCIYDAALVTILYNEESWGEVAFLHLCQLQTNAYGVTRLHDSVIADGISEEEQIRSGSAVYPIGSLFNHACSPNTALRFEGRSLTIRAIRDIPAGTEVTNCYGPYFGRMKRDERQRLLKGQYFFHCKCWACCDDSMRMREADAPCPRKGCDGRATHDGDRELLICLKCGHVADDREFMDARSRYMKALKAGDAWLREMVESPEISQEKASSCMREFVQASVAAEQAHGVFSSEYGGTQDRLARLWAMMGDFKKSAACCKRSATAVESVYGSHSSEYGHEACKLAELQFNAIIVNESTVNARTAIDILTAHYGEHYAKVRDMTDMLVCLRGV